MDMISLPTAITLTEKSERTLWRLIADGSIRREMDAGKAVIDLASLKPYLCLPLDDLALVQAADHGDAVAQTDLALIFLANGKPKGAVEWLEQAAGQAYPDAMYWLGRCYIDGEGLAQDENLGLIWIAKAAADGHLISIAQMAGMRGRFG